MSFTIDAIGLLVLAIGSLLLCVQIYRTDRALRDPDHPDHETATEAVGLSQEQQSRDIWRFL